MKVKRLNALVALSLISLMACSQNKQVEPEKAVKPKNKTNKTVESEPHRYGGWYCPDNLNGFPAVDLKDWSNVPVIRGRLPTKEEAKSEASLIFVDTKKHPTATSFDLELPQLATYNNLNTRREELIVVIQAVKVGNDSIVGFRYLNGGNGSARINEVNFITNEKIDLPPSSQFVTFSLTIDASSETVWKVLTNPENAKKLQPPFDPNNSLKEGWRKGTNVNFNYSDSGQPTSQYANILYGNYYIQNDYESMNYTEKFLLLEDKETKRTELKITCGPFSEDYNKQKQTLTAWAKKVKILSEEM